MSKDLTTTPPRSGGIQALTPEQIELLKRTICKDATDDELQLFLHLAQKTGLDPFTKQIHAVKRWSEKEKAYVISVQVGIDGYRLIAQRTGVYAGSDDPVYDDPKNPKKATVTVYKMIQGVRCPFVATARWNEYVPSDKQSFMWKKMPFLMLGKVAESLALRKAFPSELSGLYVDEEMHQADARIPVVGSKLVIPTQPEPGDGVQTEEYIIPYGPLAKQPLSKADPVKLRDYILEIEAKAKRLNKPIPAWGVELISQAEPVIANFENSVPMEPGEGSWSEFEPGSDG